jgi:hypothetical protein
MRTAVLLALALGLGSAPAFAQQHPVYVSAGASDRHAYRYLDLASVRRDEGASEYEFLEVQPPGGAIDVRLVRVRLSCALGRYSFVSGRIRHRGGEWTSLSAEEAGIWNETLEPGLVALVCEGAGRPAEMPVWNSLEEAVEAGRAAQASAVPPPPSQPPAPAASAPPPLPAETSPPETTPPPPQAEDSLEPGPDMSGGEKTPDEAAEPEKPPEGASEPDKPAEDEPLDEPAEDKI